MSSQNQLEQNYSLLRILGSGSFGVVFDCKNRLDGKRSAVKVTFLLDPSAQREVSNLAKLPHHDNIVQYHSCWKDTMRLNEIKRIMGSEFSNFTIPTGLESLDLLCIQMELCSENLRDWLGKQSSVGKETHFQMALQMARGLQHIHSNGLIHRDLKPDNIFLSFGDMEVKIGDLGISTNSNRGSKYVSRTKGSGTPLYLAPEQETTKYGKEVDIFALGLILFELSSPDIQPGRNEGDPQKLMSTLTMLKYRSQFPQGFAEKWSNLQGMIEKMIEINPSTRANIHEVINFFSKTEKPKCISPKPRVGAVASRNAIVHFGVTCNGCGLKEIMGVRYKCSVCSGYNLCEQCEKKVVIHPKSHPLLKLQEALEKDTNVLLTAAALSDPFGAISLSPDGVIKVRTTEEFQKALESCVEGNTIELEEGNYVIQIVLSKDNIKIVGKGSKTKIIFTNDKSTKTAAIKLTGNSCEVRDIHVIAGEGVTGLVSGGDYNRIQNVDLEGQKGSFGFGITGSFNEIIKSSAKGFDTSLKILGNENIIDTLNVAAEFEHKAPCVGVGGNKNKISNVIIGDDDNNVAIEGKENEVINCVSTTKRNGLFTLESSAFCKIEGGLFQIVGVGGTNNAVKMVAATKTFYVFGSDHTFESCKAPQLVYEENANKSSIRMIDTSFDNIVG